MGKVFWAVLETPRSHRRIICSANVSKPLAHGEVVFSLLHKFQDQAQGSRLFFQTPVDEKGRSGFLYAENSDWILVIIDETHQGIPKESNNIKKSERALWKKPLRSATHGPPQRLQLFSLMEPCCQMAACKLGNGKSWQSRHWQLG